MATAAEIALVGQVGEASASVLAAHVPGAHGLCAACRDRLHPCSRWVHARRAAAWTHRRIGEINAEIDGRSWAAVLAPTTLLPVVSTRG